MLLSAGVVVAVACSLGALVMDDFYARLHYVTPAAVLAAPLIVLALALQATSAEGVLKLGVVGGLLLLSGPAVTVATARAGVVRERDRRDVAGGKGQHGG